MVYLTFLKITKINIKENSSVLEGGENFFSFFLETLKKILSLLNMRSKGKYFRCEKKNHKPSLKKRLASENVYSMYKM